MKKLILIAAGFIISAAAFSQSDKYTKAMETMVPVIDTTRNVDALKALSNAFERIAEAEKTQWLPYYYAALAQVNAGYFLSNGKMDGSMAAVLDPIADKAEELLNKSEALNKNNSEIYAVRKMVLSLRMMGDPMNRFMQFGAQAAQALATARKLNPGNPRVDLLEGQDKFYTPEQYGGSKTEAKKLFEEALQKYDVFKPASSIDPTWGRGTTQYFLSQVK
jgi:hypothetical protein